jgi:hypothetical protein
MSSPVDFKLSSVRATLAAREAAAKAAPFVARKAEIEPYCRNGRPATVAGYVAGMPDHAARQRAQAEAQIRALLDEMSNAMKAGDEARLDDLHRKVQTLQRNLG